MLNFKTPRDLVKELMEIEAIVDFKPERAKDRLMQVIKVLRENNQ